jgi:hypothetical protein
MNPFCPFRGESWAVIVLDCTQQAVLFDPLQKTGVKVLSKVRRDFPFGPLRVEGFVLFCPLGLFLC